MPNYYQYRTTADRYAFHPDYKRAAKDNASITEYLLRESSDLSPTTRAMLEVENLWVRAGRPYYSIHPNMVEALTDAKLEDIPSTLITCPAGCPIMTLNFAEQHEQLRLADGAFIRSVLVYHTTKSDDKSPAIIIWADARDHTIVDYKDGVSIRVTSPHAVYHPKPDRSIVAMLEAAERKPEDNSGDDAGMFHNLMRIIATIGFLDVQSGILHEDVLKRHLDEFMSTKTTEKRKEEIRKAAKKKHRGGWVICSGAELVGAQPTTWLSGSHSSESIRELKNAHIRRGHLHAYRCGKNRMQVKLRWVLPTAIRPDLPFRPIS